MTRPSRQKAFLGVAAILLAFATGVAAQLPSPNLETAFPRGAQAGTQVEVSLTGPDAADVTGVVFDTASISATKLDGLKFQVVVAAECPPGMHELRAVGRYGISTPLAFVVGDVPEVQDPGKNHDRASATMLSVPCVVHGKADPEQRDCFKFSATKGQELRLSCLALALDSPMDPVLTILDHRGGTVARGDDDFDRDAFVTFVPPSDGDYFAVVQDKLFGGGPAHYYRLAIGNSSAPFFVPVLAASTTPVNGPAPRPLQEVEPNDTAASAQMVALPVELHGSFDVDWFSFQAVAGKPLWLEVVSAGEGQASDPLVVVHKVTRDPAGAEQSKKVLGLDDQPDLPAPPRWQLGSRDPAGSFVPDESATYRIHVSDHFARRGTYRLLIRDAAPDFATFALAASPANEDKKIFKWQPNVRRGGSVGFQVAAVRRGYDGEIVLRAEGLPAGLSGTGMIPAGAAMGLLVFHATPEVQPWAGFAQVFAEGGGVTREVRAVHYRWNVENRDNQRLSARYGAFAVGIANELAPLALGTGEAKVWEAAVGTDLEIPVQLTRSNADARPKGEWQLAPAGLPGLNKFDPVKFDGASAAGAKLVLRLQNKDGNAFKPGTYTLFLRAAGVVDYKSEPKAKPRDLKDVIFSPPIELKITEAPPAPAAPAK